MGIYCPGFVVLFLVKQNIPGRRQYTDIYIDSHIVCSGYITILIGYYTVDCTIPNYIWPIGSSNMVKSSGHESKYISVLYSQLYNYLFIIYPTV